MPNSLVRDENTESAEDSVRELLDNLSAIENNGQMSEEDIKECFYYLNKVIEIANLDIDMADYRDGELSSECE